MREIEGLVEQMTRGGAPALPGGEPVPQHRDLRERDARRLHAQAHRRQEAGRGGAPPGGRCETEVDVTARSTWRLLLTLLLAASLSPALAGGHPQGARHAPAHRGGARLVRLRQGGPGQDPAEGVQPPQRGQRRPRDRERVHDLRLHGGAAHGQGGQAGAARAPCASPWRPATYSGRVRAHRAHPLQRPRDDAARGQGVEATVVPPRTK